MGRRPSEERGRYWRDVMTQQRRSGLSVAAFCRQHAVSPATFYGWRRRLAGGASDRSREVSFVPLALDQAVPPRATEFSLQLANGVQVTVPGNFDEGALGRLLRVAGAVEPGHA
jgi:transposase-like protein